IDPCYTYISLDEPWRATDSYYNYGMCDYNVEWNGCHCGSTALIHSWKMEWSPVRSVSPGEAAVITNPTL
ncbi:hypothetical protein M9458_024400, partial [Cirrhinus mrigala]